jgi:heme/copper-type cytochrome/quinol oxidase subunit 4
MNDEALADFIPRFFPEQKERLFEQLDFEKRSAPKSTKVCIIVQIVLAVLMVPFYMFITTAHEQETDIAMIILALGAVALAFKIWEFRSAGRPRWRRKRRR